MGRGRAKAKQTKVARELKYNSGGTDLNRLREELIGAPPPPAAEPEADEPDEEYVDPYADIYGDDDDEDDETGRSA
ncbi:MAG: DUF3073 domain-containing protein [Frankiaceae bacterium]